MTYHLNLIENLLSKFDVLPHPLIDSLVQVVAGRCLQIATKIDLFEAVRNKTISPEELSKEIKTSKEGLLILLDCLEAQGYLEKNKNDRYSLTRKSKKFLLEKSDSSIKNVVLFTDYVFGQLLNLEETLKNGGPKRVNLETFTPNQWEIFNKAMLEIAKNTANEVAYKIPVKRDYVSLLDIGGSHGMYSIALCKKNQKLRAEILDLSPTKDLAEKNIKENNIEEKVKFIVGDMHKDNFGEEKYDIALAFNLVHGLNNKQNIELTKKVYRSMKEGGIFVVLDQIKNARGNSQLSKLVATTMGVMLFNQAGGKTYSFLEVSDWMRKNGFLNIEMKLLRDPGNALIIGHK